MKKLFLLMAILATAATSCDKRPQPLAIDRHLTADEKQAGLFTPEVMWKMGRIASPSLSPDGTNALFTVTYYNVEENRGISVINLKSGNDEPIELTDYTSNNVDPRWSADGKLIYFLSDRSGSNQIWSMTPDGKNQKQISKLDKDVEGFGIAPAGDRIFYVLRVQVAERKSSDVHKDMPKSNARIYDDLMCRHWNYWDEGSYLHIFVGNLTSEGIANGKDIIGEKAEWDTPLAPYFDMGEIAWNNAGTRLAYTCKPLTGKEYAVSTDSDIFVYDCQSEQTTNICKTGTHTDPMVGYDKYPVWSPDDNMIAFLSQRRAGNESDKPRLFIYNCQTAETKDLTADFDYNAENVVWNGLDELYFISPMQATLQLCKVSTDGKVEVVTAGDHDLHSLSLAAGRALVSRTTLSSAPELCDVNLKTGELTQITNINKEVYDNIKMGRVEKRWVTTTDGKQMLTWVVLPPDFDATKSYPTLLYCEGGPQSVISQFWSYRWNFQLMAAQGYIVVAPNRRGLPSFGQEWLDQISGDYSGQNIKDYLSAIDNVAKEPWADATRMGCVGASYGGYSVFFLAGHHQKRFKAFIAHCGIFDFDSMYGHTEELFFVNNDYGGSYWDKTNATAMRSYANSPHKFVDQWDTPILIFTGENDFRIPYTQSLEAFTAARMRNIDARLVEFADEAHQVFKPQNSMVWNREFFGWLDKYLKK